jgi:hypothetical protein
MVTKKRHIITGRRNTMTKYTLTARIALFLALAALAPLAAQNGGSGAALLNVGAYVSSLGAGKISDGRTIVPVKYEDPLSDEEYYSVAKLGGNPEGIDTDYEALLATYYFQKAANIRPPEAVRELPVNNRTSELRISTAAYMDMRVARFTGSDAAPYAAALKFITDRSKVSEADIKKFMSDGIRSALVAEMSKGRNGYVPLEIYNDWKQRGYGDFIGTATDVLVAFFENPTQRNYEMVRGMVARQLNLVGQGDILAFNRSASALMGAIKYINQDFGNKIDIETTSLSRIATFAKTPNDQRLNVFSIPYAATQR